jgi:hypothetical protein
VTQRIKQLREAKHGFEELRHRVATHLSPGSDSRTRACQLLDLIRWLEEIADKTPEPVLDDLLHDAILACGFTDEAEALRAVMTYVYPELLCTDVCADCAREKKDTLCLSAPDHTGEDRD